MGVRKDATRGERLAEFLRRLGAAPAAAGFDEAFRQVGDILNAVEDEMTSIPFDPANWQTDGRLYPPQADSMRAVPGRGDVKRLRTRGHHILIGDNGAIEIRDLSGRVHIAKPGADGRSI
jgi:hypothetical protein